MSIALTDKFYVYLVTTNLPVGKSLMAISCLITRATGEIPRGLVASPTLKKEHFCFHVDYLNNELNEKICFN